MPAQQLPPLAPSLATARSLFPTWLCLLTQVAVLSPGLEAQLETQSYELLVGAVGSPGDHRGAAVAAGDFNGDGFADVALGVPDANGGSQIGRVDYYLGDSNGFGTQGSVTAALIGLIPQTGMRFGAALASGDFDGDDIDDLAIGIPGRLVDGDDNAGAVAVLYGASTPFDPRSAQLYSQDNLAGAVEAGDAFGHSLATGDLDGDGTDDLAIGVPGEDIVAAGFGPRTDAGAVNVVYGILDSGLNNLNNIVLHQEVIGVILNVNHNDRFGSALAIGDFTGDLRPDLAVGIPGEFRGGFDNAGAVQIFVGGPDGIDVFQSQVILSQLDPTIQGTAEADDEFGASLAVGDFDGNRRLDLAVGVPGESEFQGVAEAGAVQVFYGFPAGLGTANGDLFDKSTGGGSVSINAFDRFGTALASGDFDADDHDDLAIGTPLDNPAGAVNAGTVTILSGYELGLSMSFVQVLDMDAFGVLEAGDEFGRALATGRFNNRTGGFGLVVGIPNREIFGSAERGAAVAIFSGAVFNDDFESGGIGRWGGVVP